MQTDYTNIPRKYLCIIIHLNYKSKKFLETGIQILQKNNEYCSISPKQRIRTLLFQIITVNYQIINTKQRHKTYQNNNSNNRKQEQTIYIYIKYLNIKQII